LFKKSLRIYTLIVVLCLDFKSLLSLLDTFAAHNTIMNSEGFGKGNLLITKGDYDK